MILPSKKVLSILIVAAALVFSIIIVFGRDKASSAINYAGKLVAGEKISIPQNPSWQNELGNIGFNIEPQEMGTTSDETTTDVISRTLVSNYLALKESGKLDGESAQKLIDQTIDYVGKNGIQYTKITQLQLNLVADNGKTSITQYGENLGNILKNKKPTDIQEEIGILMKLQSGDYSDADRLEEIVANYEKMAQELTKMPVPLTFVKAHLDITNGIKGLTTALKEMKPSQEDPFGGLVALQLYQESLNIGSQAMGATISFISKNNIIYKQGSGGYYLLYGI